MHSLYLDKAFFLAGFAFWKGLPQSTFTLTKSSVSWDFRLEQDSTPVNLYIGKVVCCVGFPFRAGFRSSQPCVEEGICDELLDIINYGLIGLMKLNLKCNFKRLSREETLTLYRDCLKEVTDTMMRKNHDYKDAWRNMLYESLILQIKVSCTRILSQSKRDINFFPLSYVQQLRDIVNYAVFARLHPNVP